MSAEQTFTEGDLRQMVLRLAHEIRNPLATIQSAAQLLEHLTHPEGETAEFYESIYVEIGRIDRVVRDMQRFVRLDEQSAAVAVRVEEAVVAASEAVASISPGRQSTIEVRGGPDATVLVDRRNIEAAIQELLDNATRFSAEDSRVEVSWHLGPHGFVGIDVEDHGPGIATEDQERIHRPFYSSSTQGTGLGLNIVARTCQLAGGRLEWRNRDCGGVCFTMVLPNHTGD